MTYVKHIYAATSSPILWHNLSVFRQHLTFLLDPYVMKRANSPGTTRLTAHISPFNSSVTLFKPEDTTAAGPSTPRRSKRVKLEDASISKIADLEDTIEEQNKPRPRSQTKSKSKSKATTSKGKVKPIQQFLETPHPAPPRWKETYETIKEMRSHIVAPVDTMGCDQAQLKETVPKVRISTAYLHRRQSDIPSRINGSLP